MKRRNPLLAGLFNMLLPGSSHLYVDNDRRKFILFFIGSCILIAFATVMGNNIQNTRSYTLPQGVCTGTLLLIIFAALFYNGMQAANARNGQSDSAARYQARRTTVSQDNQSTKLEKLQKQRDEGLISIEQYDAKKAEIESKKE